MCQLNAVPRIMLYTAYVKKTLTHVIYFCSSDLSCFVYSGGIVIVSRPVQLEKRNWERTSGFYLYFLKSEKKKTFEQKLKTRRDTTLFRFDPKAVDLFFFGLDWQGI